MIKLLKNGLIEITINPYILQIAEQYTNQNRVETKNSFLKGSANLDGNLVGNIGEVLFEFLYPQAIRVNSVDYDFILNDRKIDVKSKSFGTYNHNIIPSSQHEMSVYSYLMNKQKNDDYAFFFIKKDKTKAWFCGTISKDEFKKKAKLWRIGDIDTRNSFKFEKECYNISIEKLDKRLGDFIDG